jgi:hypothetical protein
MRPISAVAAKVFDRLDERAALIEFAGDLIGRAAEVLAEQIGESLGDDRSGRGKMYEVRDVRDQVLSEVMSMTNRYFTSLCSMRS